MAALGSLCQQLVRRWQPVAAATLPRGPARGAAMQAWLSGSRSANEVPGGTGDSELRSRVSALKVDVSADEFKAAVRRLQECGGMSW